MQKRKFKKKRVVAGVLVAAMLFFSAKTTKITFKGLAGSASSNPTAAAHFSVIYKDSNERRTFIDTQGLMTSSTCEEHGCRSKVIQ